MIKNLTNAKKKKKKKKKKFKLPKWLPHVRPNKEKKGYCAMCSMIGFGNEIPL